MTSGLCQETKIAEVKRFAKGAEDMLCGKTVIRLPAHGIGTQSNVAGTSAHKQTRRKPEGPGNPLSHSKSAYGAESLGACPLGTVGHYRRGRIYGRNFRGRCSLFLRASLLSGGGKFTHQHAVVSGSKSFRLVGYRYAWIPETNRLTSAYRGASASGGVRTCRGEIFIERWRRLP